MKILNHKGHEGHEGKLEISAFVNLCVLCGYWFEQC